NALFRGLPADRSDGRAWDRDAALWTDEAGRALKSAPPGRKTLRGGSAPPGQRARHAVEYGRLPDQAETRRADARVPHDSGPRTGRVRETRGATSQHVPQ